MHRKRRRSTVRASRSGARISRSAPTTPIRCGVSGAGNTLASGNCCACLRVDILQIELLRGLWVSRERVLLLVRVDPGVIERRRGTGPVFEVNSEWFDYGNGSDRCWSPNGPGGDGLVKARNHGKCLYGYYVDIGSGHCNVSDDSIGIMRVWPQRRLRDCRCNTWLFPNQPRSLPIIIRSGCCRCLRAQNIRRR